MTRSGQVRIKRHRNHVTSRDVARHGEAIGGSTSTLKVVAGKSAGFAFTGPGLALIALRRRPGVKATG